MKFALLPKDKRLIIYPSLFRFGYVGSKFMFHCIVFTIELFKSNYLLGRIAKVFVI